MMMALLETAVKVHAVSSRQVCDALLSSDHLRYEKADFWVSALKLVRKIIGKIYSYSKLFWLKKTFSPSIRSY
jgi:hypothetical protein